VFLFTDSISVLSGDYARLYGHASYRDSTYQLDADTMIYLMRLEKLEARGNVKVPKSADQKTAETMAAEAVKKYIDGKAIRKTIIVPGRLINIVV